MILADLRTHLLSFTDITNKIGTRVYINRAPEKTPTPYLIISRTSGTPQYSLDGEIGKAQSMLEITAWDRDPNGPYKANVIGDLVRDKLSGWRGNWCDTYVDGCTLEGEPIDRDEIPNDGSSDGWHAVDQTYQVTHSSPVPTLS